MLIPSFTGCVPKATLRGAREGVGAEVRSNDGVVFMQCVNSVGAFYGTSAPLVFIRSLDGNRFARRLLARRRWVRVLQ